MKRTQINYFLKTNSLSREALLTILLMFGFIFAVALRVLIGQPFVAYSAFAGLIFAGILFGFCVSTGLKTSFTLKTLVIGLSGASILLIVPFGSKIYGPIIALPAGNFLGWAVVVAVVALAEEAFLRGSFFNAARIWKGNTFAILTAALLFSLLHIPLYGWHIFPLDFIVGIWLGLLRLYGGSWLSAGIAHAITDIASWWLL